MDLIVIVLIVIFLISIGIAFWLGRKEGAYARDRYWEKEMPLHRKDAINKSRAVLGGNFSEQLAPYLPNFKYLPTECRFLGKPIDLLVFKGMDNKEINEVVFVEIKSGKSKLNKSEKNLKEAIEKKRVRWEEYRIPDELTRGKDI